MRRERFAGLVWLATPLVRPPRVRDVARSVHGFQVETWCAADRRLESVRMSDRPGGHETAVAVPPDTCAIRVGVGSFEDLVEHGHKVEEVLAAPIATHHLREVATVRARPTRIREDHNESVACQQLLHVVEGVAIK